MFPPGSGAYGDRYLPLPQTFVKWLEDVLIIFSKLDDGKVFALAIEVLIKIYIKLDQWEKAKCLVEEHLSNKNRLSATRYLLYIAVKSGNLDELRDLLK